MLEELVYQLGLELIPGIGHKGVKQLISHCGSASAVFTTPKHRLLKIPGVGDKMASTIKRSNTFKEAEFIIKLSEKINAEILHFTNSCYPKRLKQIYDAPNIIYSKGKGDLNPQRTVAIVGSRKATNYGKNITNKIVLELSSIGVTVVSGLAFGIDIQAHKAALKNGIPTYAVIAGGLDRIYPSIHKKYVDELLEMGGIISESIPGTKPDPYLFPARNRIIAGLSDATIVVEATEKGGALITATMADSYNRVVFAVPGNVGNAFSTGTNKLIASQKALIYTGVEDLIYHLGWKLGEQGRIQEINLPDLTADEEILYTLLKEEGSAVEIDIIALKSQFSINRTATILLSLEFKNLVKSLPGKKYQATIGYQVGM